jgi:hypothetical protein
MVRTNIFLRLLDYRINLADEIDANIQRLVSRSSAARMIERKMSSSSIRKQRQLDINNNEHKHTAPPPTALGEITENSDVKYINDENESPKKISPAVDAAHRELSTKFRALVRQHRKMVKQFNEGDEFVPFLDRKVNFLMILRLYLIFLR